MPTVLVVEDEPSYVDALRIALRHEGFRVLVANDGREAIATFEAGRPDIVLLDVMLPGMSGIDVCRHIRSLGGAVGAVPIIMCTARSSEIDTVVGLEVGADDYIAKPYRMREVIARMRAVLRRVPASDESNDAADVIEIGEVRMDPSSHEVTVASVVVELPLKEFELLQILMENAGRVLPRDVLIDRVWGAHYVGDTKTLDVHIKRLRGKIEAVPSKPVRITTIRGLGYKYERG